MIICEMFQKKGNYFFCKLYKHILLKENRIPLLVKEIELAFYVPDKTIMCVENLFYRLFVFHPNV